MIITAGVGWKLFSYILEPAEVFHVIFRLQVQFQNQNKYLQKNPWIKEEKITSYRDVNVNITS